MDYVDFGFIFVCPSCEVETPLSSSAIWVDVEVARGRYSPDYHYIPTVDCPACKLSFHIC